MIGSFTKSYGRENNSKKFIILGIILSIIGCIGFISVISYYVALKVNLPIDMSAIKYVQHIENNHLSDFVKVVTHIGGTMCIVTMTLIIIISLYKNKLKNESLYFAINMLGIWIFNFILKMYFRRERPSVRIINASGYSLPSGHSMVFLTFCIISSYLILVYVKNKAKARFLSLLIILIAISIGMSRIYLRVHFCSDVLAGWSAALLWSGVSIAIHSYKRRR